MGRNSSVRIHELTFCGDIKSWADAIFSLRREWPFARAEIEEFGQGSSKRQDLRIFDRNSRQQKSLLGNCPVLPGAATEYKPAFYKTPAETVGVL